MPAHKPIHINWYVFSDAVAAVTGWLLFAIVRKWLLGEPFGGIAQGLKADPYFQLTVICIPLFWVFLFAATGAYRQSLYRKSRLNEFTNTFMISLVGCMIIFFLLILNDASHRRIYYYKAFFSFCVIQFVLTFLGRAIILTLVKNQLLSGRVRINTLIVGNNRGAVKIYNEVQKNFKGLGYHMTGYINTISTKNGLSKWIKCLGTLDDLEKVTEEQSIKLVIIALDSHDNYLKEAILNRLSEKDVEIKMVPDKLDILTGSVKAGNILGAMLIDIQTGLMPEWQQNLKRLVDVIFSALGLVLLSPLLLFIVVRTRFSSPGLIIYSQMRTGYKGSQFSIYKFRSMYADA